MISKVSSRGLLVPKRLLDGAEKVEIRKEGDIVLIMPVLDRDPILDLGTHLIVCDVDDASEDHDRYLYGDAKHKWLSRR